MAGDTQSDQHIPSFKDDILPLFSNDMQSVECMRSRGVLLLNYDWFKQNGHAKMVYDKLKPDAIGDRMPLGGPYWPTQQLDLFKEWMDKGCPP